MSNQELFDEVYKRIVAQGRGAINETTRDCLYCTPDGARCGIGIMLPDDHEIIQHAEDFADDSVQEILCRFPDLEEILGNDLMFLASLQTAHDWAAKTPSFVEVYKGRMRGVAKSFGLQFHE